MGYDVSVIYPKEEQMNNEEHKFTTISKTEILGEMESDQIVSLVKQFERSGYMVTPAFAPPENEEEKSPFDIADELTTLGVDYKATLKCKNKGSYSDAKTLVDLLYSHGFDSDVDVKLKINDDSAVDFDNESTWMDMDDAIYKVKPKASSDNIAELKGVYDTLSDKGYDISIDIKPKKSKEESNLDAQLSAYPDQTGVKLTLKESDVY